MTFSAADAAVQTEDPVLDDRAHRQELEGPVELVPAGVGVLRLLLEAPPALVAEAVDGVDRRILVVPADQVDLRRVSHLQREEQADGLEREAAAVHEVAEEEVVHGVDVAVLPVRRRLVPREEAHEVKVLAVDIAVDLDRRAQPQHHVLAPKELQDLLAELGHLPGVQQKPVRVGVGLPRRRL